ncbi:MAG: methionine--tRNA ligase [Candidatus Micrarchaeaceae archaeon]
MGAKIITAALPYVYSIPHIGNLVGSVLPADVYFKYCTEKGEDAIFICGSDQHGTPIELEAIKRGVKPETLANEMHRKVMRLFKKFGCTFSKYGKTHSLENKATVYEIFRALLNNGFITEREEEQAYCENDKRFLVDRLIEGTCPFCKGNHARGDQCDDCGRLLNPREIIDPYCKICGKKDIVFKKTKNLAIELGKLSKEIEDLAEERKLHWSKNAYNKARSLIKEGLLPRDITRNMKWGFKVPMKGYEDHVFYVWFDALIGYIGITRSLEKEDWVKYWKSEDSELIQFFGKDNIEFHTIMWPAILIGSRMGLVTPSRIKAMEHLLINEEKISKSRGNVINLDKAAEAFEPDYWRFALMYMAPESGDSSFTIEGFVDTINKVINDKIGNLLHRAATIQHTQKLELKPFIDEEANRIRKEYEEFMERLEFRPAIEKILELAAYGNGIINDEKPWELDRSNTNSVERVRSVMSRLNGICILVIYLLYPFMPKAANKCSRKYFNVREAKELIGKMPPFSFERKPKPIFQRADMNSLIKSLSQ